MSRVALLVALLVAPFLGCGSALQGQALVANGFALAANRALPLVADAYRAEGLRRIALAADRGQAEAALGELRIAWQPVWGTYDGVAYRGGAWEAARTAHEAWAYGLERAARGTPLGPGDVDAAGTRLRAAYCALRAVLPTTQARALMPALLCAEGP